MAPENAAYFPGKSWKIGHFPRKMAILANFLDWWQSQENDRKWAIFLEKRGGGLKRTPNLAIKGGQIFKIDQVGHLADLGPGGTSGEEKSSPFSWRIFSGKRKSPSKTRILLFKVKIHFSKSEFSLFDWRKVEK